METVREITVDARRGKGPLDRWATACVSASRAYLFLRRDHQEHLKLAARECGFRYVRFHGLFQDDMGVYREDRDGDPIYSWQYVDQVYDFLMDIGLRPIVVFDFMPEALASGIRTVYWERANVTPPRDYHKWAALVRETVKHFTERYGQEEVNRWLFEVWNEPDNPPFFTGDFGEYCKLYDCTARAVKSVCGDYRVGGPAIAGNPEWMTGLIGYCTKHGVPLDYVSTHTYCLRWNFEPGRTAPPPGSPQWRIPAWKPGPSWALGNVIYDPNGGEQAVDTALRAVAQSPQPQLPVYFTEFGLSCDYWDPLRDAYESASYLLSRLKRVWGKVRGMAYCEVSDVFEEDGPPTGHFHGGFGLINLQGIRKPTFYAYRFLHDLADTQLACEDDEAIATRGENGGVKVLFWNSAFRQDEENRVYYLRERRPRELGTARLRVTGLAAGEYTYRLSGVGYRRGDPFTLYREMGSPASMSRAEVRALSDASSDLVLTEARVTVGTDGVFEAEAAVRENDVFFAELTPAAPSDVNPARR